MSGLKVLSLIEPVSREFLEIAAKELGINLELYGDYVHPQEDYLLQSSAHSIFAVADGVTLEPNLINGYPNPSPAGEAAKIFCETVVKKAEESYQHFSREHVLKVFRAGNRAVGVFNAHHGRTQRTSNFWDFDLCAATAAFAVLKDRTLYWASICDSFVAHFGYDGHQKFRSPECWPDPHRFLSPDWDSLEVVEQKKRIRKIYRNGIGKRGELIGYGVVTGEKAAERYLNQGSLKVEDGDLVALFTDGFEEYFKLPEFTGLFITARAEHLAACGPDARRIAEGNRPVSEDEGAIPQNERAEMVEARELLQVTKHSFQYRTALRCGCFIRWPTDLEEQVRRFTRARVAEDPRRFGHERSLVVIAF